MVLLDDEAQPAQELATALSSYAGLAASPLLVAAAAAGDGGAWAESLAAVRGVAKRMVQQHHMM